jgi:SAM-dependent methyltransferase
VADGLNYQSKPPLVPEKNVKEIPMIPMFDIPKINVKALQFWIDHLGEAIYNPVLLEDNGHGMFRDGYHRARCLFEIGEPALRVRFKGNWDKLNVKKPKKKHFREDKTIKIRQYYPFIKKTPEVLTDNFFKTEEGRYYKDTLTTPMSFRDINDGIIRCEYRIPMMDEVLKRISLDKKRVLDVGCRNGWASFLAWESGAVDVVGIDVLPLHIKILKAIRDLRIVSRGTGEGWVDGMVISIEEYAEREDYQPFDIVFMFNVFHHMLISNKEKAWSVLNRFLSENTSLFMMTRRLENAYADYNGNIKKALTDKTGRKPELIYNYGEREFYAWLAT